MWRMAGRFGTLTQHATRLLRPSLRQFPPTRREERIQQSCALFHEHATKNIHSMIHRGHGENVSRAAGGTRLRIPGAKHQARHARMDDG